MDVSARKGGVEPLCVETAALERGEGILDGLLVRAAVEFAHEARIAESLRDVFVADTARGTDRGQRLADGGRVGGRANRIGERGNGVLHLARR